MNGRMIKLKTAILLASSLSVAVILLNSCKKSEPRTSRTPAEREQEVTERATHEHATAMAKSEGEVVAAEVEQTICPVMENPINKQLFIEYKGKKVYFCCPECKPRFEADPEKYLAKLPQFQK
jgi:YHS domain-containing protein